MIIGAATALWLGIFLLVLIVLLLGAIYTHMKNTMPWDGVDRRNCTTCDEAIARYHREHHDQGPASATREP